MERKWSALHEIGDSATYLSQPAFIIRKNDMVLYYGDRWVGDGEKYFESGYVIYPLLIDEGKLTMRYMENVRNIF